MLGMDIMGRYVFQILFVVMLIMSTSCTAMYHGFSTKVTLESQINYGSSDTLKLVAEGKRKTNNKKNTYYFFAHLLLPPNLHSAHLPIRTVSSSLTEKSFRFLTVFKSLSEVFSSR